MPRGSAGSSSKRQGLHSNSTHHANGGPTLPKRSHRAPRNPNATSTPPTVAPASQPAVQEVSAAAAAAATQFHLAANGTANTEAPNGWHGKEQQQRFYDCVGEDGDSFGEGMNSTMGDHQKIDLNPSGGRSSEVPAATVLTSFPLLDTITLLILFLQIPPTVLTIVHFLFFIQTFVPPSTTLFSLSTTSMPSFTNLLLQGSNGSPSLLTIMIADCVLASVSLFLWPSAWNFLVEFAQAIIAMSLGAGNAAGDNFQNVAVCAGVMSGVKVVQGRFRLSDAWDSIQPTRQERVSHMLSGRVDNAGWLRTFFAIHIVAQAIMKATRSWLIRRPETADSTPGSSNGGVKDSTTKQKDKDPEAAAGVSPAPTLERSNSVGCAKRKKKTQVQSVRGNQPLWATMASAIIHIAKEVERSQLSSEASNTSVGGAGAASNEIMSEDCGSVWITKIGSTEVMFLVGMVGGMKGEDGYGYVANGGVDATGRDSSFPFFVRVNGIVWPQTSIYPVGRGSRDSAESNGDVGGGGEVEWMVEVNGLTGSTEYDFEFVRRGGPVFYSTSACTLPAQASAVQPVKHQQPSRPLSPITTLLHSLTQANALLAEKKSNLKSMRKAHKTALSEVRKEMEKHRGLIGNDRGEERAFRRNLALREQIKRAEEETEQMAAELADLQHLPDKLKPEWESKKKQWQAEKRRLSAALAKATEEKANADRQAAAVESEAAALATKKEKLQARLTKLRVDLGKLDSANSEGSDTKEKKQAEREATELHRKNLEKEYNDAIERLETRIAEYTRIAQENWSTYYALEQAAADMQPLPGSSGHNSLVLPFGMVPHDHSQNLQMSGSAGTPGRERSMSLFSDGSVITNLSELGHANTGTIPAFEPFGSPFVTRGNSLEYASMGVGVIGRGKGGD